MPRRLLPLLGLSALIVALGVGLWSFERTRRVDALRDAAESALYASLREAPLLADLEAGDALASLDEAAALDESLEGLRRCAEALSHLQHGNLEGARGSLDIARATTGCPEALLRFVDGHIAEADERQSDAEALLGWFVPFEDDAPTNGALEDAAVDSESATSPLEERGLLSFAKLLRSRGRDAESLPLLESLRERLDAVAVIEVEYAGALEAVGRDREAYAAYSLASAQGNRDATLAVARLQHIEGDLDAALETLGDAEGNGDPDFWMLTARIQGSRGNIEEGRRALRQMAGIERNSARPWAALGAFESEHGNPDAALSAFRQALQFDDADGDDWLRLGNELCKQRSFDDAITAFEGALQRNARPSAALNGQGVAYMNRQNEGDALRAMNAFSQAASSNSEDPDPLLNLGLLRRREGDEEGAQLAFRAALERSPEHSRALALLATQ